MRTLGGIIVFSLLAIASFGQRFHGGAMGGLAATQLDGDQLGGYNKPGVRLGGWVNTRISPNLILQLELEYLQKGSKISEQELQNRQSYFHCRLNYIQVPLVAKTNLMPRLVGEAGLAAGYLTEALIDDDGNGFREPEDLDNQRPFNQFEFSGLVGINYELGKNFVINVRFNYSLFPVRAHPGGQKFWLNRGQFNNAMLFTLYYQID